MAAKLRFPNEAPPGGFRFFQPETRLWITGLTMDDVIWGMVQHRQYKGLSGAEYNQCRDELEAQLCERLGSLHCTGIGERTDYSQTTDAGQILGFTKAFLKHAINGFEFCDIEEAAARAETCRSCPLNMARKGCNWCGPVVALIEKTIPTERQFGGVENCAVCGCALKAKVNATADVIKAAENTRSLVYPTYCWVGKL